MSFEHAIIESAIDDSMEIPSEDYMLRRRMTTTLFKVAHTMNSTRFRTDSFDEFYEKHEEIGKGHFADVYRVIEKSTGTEYAAKYIKKKRLESSRRGVAKKDIQNEVNILAEMDHDNIIYLHQVYENRHQAILVLELVGGGELFDYISEREWLTEEEASNFVKQILLGLKYMHSRGVAHLDLKPENVMLKSADSHELKIIDFGVSKKLNPDEEYREMLGTTEFVSPEVINYEPISLNSDMWSIGVITYIMLSGASPFLGDTQQETYANIIGCDYEFDEEFFSHTSELAKDFIRKVLVKDQTKRASVDECLVHPWIRPKSMADKDNRRKSKINIDSFKMFHTRSRWKHSMKVVVLCNNLSRLRQSQANGMDSSKIESNGVGKSHLEVQSKCTVPSESQEPIKDKSSKSTSGKLSKEDGNFVMSAIFGAIRNNNKEGLARLLSLTEIDLDQTNEFGESAIHISAGRGQLQILKDLAFKGAALGTIDHRGDSALHWASREGHLDVVKYLVSQRVHVNLQNKRGETCLHTAADGNHTSVIDYLTSIHISLDLQDTKLETGLHKAARHGNLKIVLLLWKSKADLKIKNKDGDIALDIASKNGHLECKQVLIECML